ncbi:uncharacterized protein LOC143695206 [Agelaius phoeniceus]|uniref:uncharacterized protein LOC143695206 n=1 Tax=Agelaius phoeniceus TaxID=39638 RepID=UPI0040552569
MFVRNRKPAWMRGEGTPKGTAALTRLDLGHKAVSQPGAGLSCRQRCKGTPAVPSGVRAALPCPEKPGELCRAPRNPGSPAVPRGARAALPCPEELGQPCRAQRCKGSPAVPRGARAALHPTPAPAAAPSLPSSLLPVSPGTFLSSDTQAGHFRFILALAKLSCPCAGATRGVLVSRNEAKVFCEPEPEVSAAGQGEDDDAAARTAQPATAQGGIWGLSLDGGDEQPLCRAQDRAAPSRPARSPRWLPALARSSSGALGAARRAQPISNPRGARSKPKGGHSCPGLSPWSPQSSSCTAGAVRHTHSWAWGAQAACPGCPIGLGG